jgi:DNA-binding NtrC family response regulator
MASRNLLECCGLLEFCVQRTLCRIQDILQNGRVQRLLFAWVGRADLKASSDGGAGGLGPIAEAATKLSFDELHLLYNYPDAEVVGYPEWLATRSAASVSLHSVELSGPTQHREIYEAAVATCNRVIAGRADSCEVTFHLSPGTPAMHAVWILIAKTRISAALIESSKERGVVSVAVPFDISAELIPDIVGAQLAELTSGTPPDLAGFKDIIHRSKEMGRVLDQAARVAPWGVPVLIEGESGTGKELLARAIHDASGRKGKLIPINCGAIPSELVESVLFGHERGSFSGASELRVGMFETANRGTLFLDELGELPRDAQVKLLRALQQGEITRIGKAEPIKVDVRLIAATNRSLMEEVAAHRFREDLFYRLAVAVLRLPALRDRKGDLPLLVDHLLSHVNQQSKVQGFQEKKLSPGAKNLLSAHGWPGNVRELENTLSRAVIWSVGPTISAEEMRSALLTPPSQRGGDILHRPLGEGLKLLELLQEVARHYLKRAMDESDNNKTKAAALVGLPSYQTFTNWLAKYKVGG